MLTNLATASLNLTSYSTEMQGINTAITKGGIIPSLLAINDMVTKANDLQNSLGKMPDIKLDAKLKTLATNLGIGGKFN